MKKKTRVVALTMALAFAAMNFAACGGSGESTESGNRQESGGDTAKPSSAEGISHADEGYPDINSDIAALDDLTLEVWLASDQGARPMWDELKEKFEESYPNITINYNKSIAWEDMPSKVKLAVNSGAAPDVATHHPFVAGAQNFAEPLDDLWEEWDAEDEFLESTIEDSTWNSVKYGVPLNTTTIALLYNTEMYKEAGITEPPKTLDELVEVSKQLTNADKNQYGFACYANPWGLFGVIAAEGYDLMKDGSPTLTDPGVYETLQSYVGMASVDGSSLNPSSSTNSQAEEAAAMFGNERAAQMITGTWDFTTLKEQYPEVWEKTGVAVMPGSAESSVAGGGGTFVPLGAKNREAAFEFMKWTTADPFAIPYAKDFGMFPAKKTQLEDKYFSDKIYQPYVEILDSVRPYAFEAFPESADAFEQAIRAGFEGGDMKAMLESAQKIAEEEMSTGN